MAEFTPPDAEGRILSAGEHAYDQFLPQIEIFGNQIRQMIALLPDDQDRMIFLDCIAQFFFIAAVLERDRQDPKKDNAKYLADQFALSVSDILAERKGKQP